MDYDLFGKLVGDSRWSYDGLLPFFRRTESHFDAQADPQQHGFGGPISSAFATSREYTLSKVLKEAYLSNRFTPE